MWCGKYLCETQKRPAPTTSSAKVPVPSPDFVPVSKILEELKISLMSRVVMQNKHEYRAFQKKHYTILEYTNLEGIILKIWKV